VRHAALEIRHLVSILVRGGSGAAEFCCLPAQKASCASAWRLQTYGRLWLFVAACCYLCLLPAIPTLLQFFRIYQTFSHQVLTCLACPAGSILVNPWNINDVAAAIEDALTMSEEERRERHRQNFMHVATHTAQVRTWVLAGYIMQPAVTFWLLASASQPHFAANVATCCVLVCSCCCFRLLLASTRGRLLQL
jgi:hypothetical protein